MESIEAQALSPREENLGKMWKPIIGISVYVGVLSWMQLLLVKAIDYNNVYFQAYGIGICHVK